MDIVELNKQNNSSLLDIKGVFPRGEVDKIAICEHCIMRRDTDKKPFLKYTFRDVNGCRIVGRQFDIEDIVKISSTIRSAQNAVVKITGYLGYFGKRYIKVERCDVLSNDIADKIKSNFFVRNISDYDKELGILTSQTSMLLSEDMKELFNTLSIISILENSYNEEICNGLRGSSIYMINTFNNTLAQLTGRQGKLLMVANILMEAIMAKSHGDSADALTELTSIQGILSGSMTVERKKVLDILKSSLYLYFGFEQDIYCSDAFIVNTVRKFCYSVTMQKETFIESEGVFLYDGYTLSRGEI